MIDADTVEAVWNQTGGVVQLFVNDALLMAMPQGQARDLANALLAAARVPDSARVMAAPDATPVESLGQVIRREASNSDPRQYPLTVPWEHHEFLVRKEQPAVISGTDADNSFTRWSPDTRRDAVLREQYAR